MKQHERHHRHRQKEAGRDGLGTGTKLGLRSADPVLVSETLGDWKND